MYSMINRKRMIISTLIIFFLIADSVFAFILNINASQDISNKTLLKLSDEEITIITPENKTYSGSMNGYYPATFGFENALDGTDDPSWVDGQGSSEVISSLGDHNKVYQCASGYLGAGQEWDSERDNGTIEFYMYDEDATEPFQIQIQRLGVGVVFALRIINNEFQFNNGTGYFDVGKSTLNSTWYHIRVDFETTARGYMGLSQWNWRMFIDGELFGPYNFSNNWIPNRFSCYAAPFVDTARAWDAVGYSWDLNYEIGTNLNEGLLLSFENSIILDWMGYSLDGQTNKTILGNNTIPMPLQGLHLIQIYGNDSLGTIYQSNLRYFTVKYPNLKVSLEVPNSCELNITYTVNATVINIGGNDETNVNLYLFLDNIIVNSTIISYLPIEENKTIKYQWTPTEYDIYNFTAYTFPTPGEIDIGDNYKTELIRISNSVLFNGMYVYHLMHFLDEDFDTRLRYSYISGNTFRAHWSWPAFIFSLDFYWHVDTKTRIMSNNIGDPYLGDIFYDGCHDFAWIFKDAKLNDTIPIATMMGIEHSFNITGELVYNLPNFGPVEVWVLQNLNYSNAFAWYEKSTGILLNGTFYSEFLESYYSLDFQDTNVEFDYAVPPGPFNLSSNAGKPDKDGIFDLTWTRASKANKYSIYNHSSYISEINGSVTLLADEIADLTLQLSGLMDGTYYYIAVAQNKYGDTLSNCIKVDVVLPLMLNFIIPDNSCSWKVDSSQIIHWTSTGAISDIKLDLYVNDIFAMEIVSETSNDGQYSWRIPSMLEYSNHYQIKITDVFNSSIYDFSDYFEIFKPSITVISPDNSCSWECESSYYINWSCIGTISDVTLELYKDGVFVMEIVVSTPNEDVYSWTIPSELEDSTVYQVKIMDASNPAVYDFSENFEIKEVMITTRDFTLPLIIGLSTGGAVAGVVVVFLVRRIKSRTKVNR